MKLGCSSSISTERSAMFCLFMGEEIHAKHSSLEVPSGRVGASDTAGTSLKFKLKLWLTNRELTRLWSPDGMPKNTESKLISESIKLLPKEVRLILSYADPSQGHLGKIYQATKYND